MRRLLPALAGLSALLGCRPAPGPIFTLETTPQSRPVGTPSDFELLLVAGPRGVEAEGRVLVGFPHWTHAQRGEGAPGSPTPEGLRVEAIGPGGALPTSIRAAELEHWYVQVGLPREVPAEGRVRIRLGGLRAPVSAVPWELRVLADPQGGDDPVLVGVQAVTLRPGVPERLAVVAPSEVPAGGDLSVGLRLEDRYGNPTEGLPPTVRATFERFDVGRGAVGRLGDGPPPTAELAVAHTPSGLTGRIALPAPEARPWRLRVEGDFPGGEALSEPFRVVEGGGELVVWADLHGHGAASDGAGAPEPWFRYARDVAFLDAAALSEHDWQTTRPELGALFAAARATSDGGFVAIPAVETNVFGHEVGLFFDLHAVERVGAGLDPERPGGATTLWEETDFGVAPAPPRPPGEALFAALGDGVITGPHSTLAPSMGTAFPLPRALPGLGTIEVYSAHGSSECRACERSAWHEPRGDDGGFGSVREALSALPPVAMVAAGDSHDGRPGNSRWGGNPGGLTALRVKELSRGGIAEALRARRTWATSGRRTILDVEVGDRGMGAILREDEQGPIRVRVLDREPIARIDFVRDGAVAHSLVGPRVGAWHTWDAPVAAAPSWTYVKVVLADGEMAWSSPIYLR